MKRALIVANGHVDVDYLEEIYPNYDYIVACDGGYKYLKNRKVDVLIGDLDSVDMTMVEKGQKIIGHCPVKDQTDLELAIEHALEKGYNADVIGFFGFRIDHSLTNILLLKKYKNRITLKDRNNSLEYKNESFVLDKQDCFFSLIPITKISNLTIKGAKYDLNRVDIEVGESLLNSNEFLTEDVSIEFDSGEMIVVRAIEK